MDAIHLKSPETVAHEEEEKVIPWAEGNGLWYTVTQSVRDLVGVDLITFFVQNPYTCDSAESLSVRIGRHAEQVQPVLDELSRANLLKRTDLGDVIVFELTGDPKRRQTLQQYVAWLQEGYHWTRMVMDR